jgi:hypothetical protein
MPSLTPDVVPGGPAGDVEMKGGRKTRGASVKQMKRMLKKAGLKTTGRKAALTRRAKKAHLKLRGGAEGGPGVVEMNGEKVKDLSVGARRRSRKSRGFKLF